MKGIIRTAWEKVPLTSTWRLWWIMKRAAEYTGLSQKQNGGAVFASSTTGREDAEKVA